MVTNYLIIPGYKGSGEKHWQTYMESRLDNSRRVSQRDWEHPDVDEWIRPFCVSGSVATFFRKNHCP